MGLFDSRLVQLLSFLAWIAVVMLLYTLAGDLRADEAYRYMFDVGFNIGTGTGNISEKDEWITLFTVFVMLSGYFAVGLFWVDFGFVLGRARRGHVQFRVQKPSEHRKTLHKSYRRGDRHHPSVLGVHLDAGVAGPRGRAWNGAGGNELHHCLKLCRRTDD